MKKFISLVGFIVLLVGNLQAQTISDMPVFEGKDLVLRSEESTSFHTVSISDGVKDLFTVGLHRRDADPARSLVDIIYRLKKQDYKLLTSNSGSYGSDGSIMVAYYIFQKD